MTKTPSELRLPVQSLSRRADRQIRRRLRRVARQQSQGWWLFSPMALTALAVIVAIPLTSFGVRQYAYASPSVTPGTLLYGLKRGQEKRRLAAMTSAAVRAQYYLTLSQRRLDEADNLLTHKPHLARLIPTAHAVTTSGGTVPLSVDRSVVGGLIVESSQFVSLSIGEANKLADVTKRTAVLTDAQRALKRNTRTIDTLQQRVPSEKPQLKTITNAVQQIHVANHDLVERTLASPSDAAVEETPLWIDLPDEEEGFLEHFTELFEWEEAWDDEDEDEVYEAWEDDEDWSDEEDWWEEWHDDEEHQEWLEQHHLHEDTSSEPVVSEVEGLSVTPETEEMEADEWMEEDEWDEWDEPAEEEEGDQWEEEEFDEDDWSEEDFPEEEWLEEGEWSEEDDWDEWGEEEEEEWTEEDEWAEEENWDEDDEW